MWYAYYRNYPANIRGLTPRRSSAAQSFRDASSGSEASRGDESFVAGSLVSERRLLLLWMGVVAGMGLVAPPYLRKPAITALEDRPRDIPLRPATVTTWQLVFYRTNCPRSFAICGAAG